jgi:hypothetical protein
MKHGQDRGRPHSRADQQDRCLPGPEDESIARRSRLQQAACPHPGVHELAPGAVRLALDT